MTTDVKEEPFIRDVGGSQTTGSVRRIYDQIVTTELFESRRSS
jgi:hypothetical protein